jgi:hypothetical protein
MRFQGSDNSHARKQHGSAIFGGINQHLDGKPPFLTIAFWLRKLPDVGGGISQGLRRRPLRKWDRLSKRTIPGHAELPSQINGPNAAEWNSPRRQAQRGLLSGVAEKDPESMDSTRCVDFSSNCTVVLFPAVQL